MNINRNNCEAFFLDFYEGKLSVAEAEQLFDFLDQHADLKALFESYDGAVLDPFIDHVSYPDKENLRRVADLPRSINEANCEEFFIAAAEGLLDDKQQNELDKFLANHPALQQDYDLFLQTRLDAEPVVFDAKDSLRRTAFVVTAENAEELMIASVEGLLDSEKQKALDVFLAANPAYADDFALFAQTRLDAEPVVFEDKASLRRTAFVVTAENAEETMIASVEGLLHAHEQEALDTFLASSAEHAASFELYKKTILVPDNAVVFTGKSSLRRGERAVILWWQYAAAAAVIILLSLFWLNRNDVTPGKTDENPMAQLENGKLQNRTLISGTRGNDVLAVNGSDNRTVSNSNPVTPAIVREHKNVESIATGQTFVLAQNSTPSSACGVNYPTTDLIDQLSFAPETDIYGDDGNVAKLAGGWLKKKVNNTDLAAGDEQSMANSNLTGWDVANWFVNGIDKLTGAGIHLKRKPTKDGTAYSLVTSKRTFTRNFRRR